jgi:hypothetical protein
LLNNQGASRVITAEQAPVPALNRLPQAPTLAIPTIRPSAWALPALLGAGYGLAATLLVLIELGQPPQQPGFSGIRFANTVKSAGARQIVALFRDHLTWLPRPFADAPLSPNGYIWGLCVAWIAMLGLQIAAVLASRRTSATSPLYWAIGPAIASLVFLVYPPTSTDVYAYSSFGWVAEHGKNPYLVAPDSMHGDPYAIFNDWTHVRTPYGPIWTWISRGIVHFTNEDPFATALAYKLVATLAAFGLAAVTYLLARRLTNDRRLATTAFVLVCWSPILITEAGATVHLDPVMMLFAMSGLLVATGERMRSHRLGLALVAASALVKPATLPLIGLMVLVRLIRPEGIRVTARRIALDLLVIAGVAVAGYAPFWDRTFVRATIDNMNKLYVSHPLRANPLWAWALAHVDSVVGFSDAVGGDAGSATRWIAIALAAGLTAVIGRIVLRERRLATMPGAESEARVVLRLLLWAWAGATVIIGILPVNAHPWYAIWSMAPLALLWITDGQKVRSRPPIWLLGLQCWIFVFFMIYHTLPLR